MPGSPTGVQREDPMIAEFSGSNESSVKIHEDTPLSVFTFPSCIRRMTCVSIGLWSSPDQTALCHTTASTRHARLAPAGVRLLHCKTQWGEGGSSPSRSPLIRQRQGGLLLLRRSPAKPGQH